MNKYIKIVISCILICTLCVTSFGSGLFVYAACEDSEQMGSEQVDSKQKASEQMGSEQVDSKQKASEQKASEQVGSEQMGSEQVVSEQVDSEQMDSEQVASEQKDSTQMASEQVDSEQGDEEKELTLGEESVLDEGLEIDSTDEEEKNADELAENSDDIDNAEITEEYTDSTVNYTSTYPSDWAEPTMSNLIIFVGFSDGNGGTSHVSSHSETSSLTKDKCALNVDNTLSYFNGTAQKKQGMQRYLYNISYGNLRVDNIMPQYDAASGSIKPLILDNTADQYGASLSDGALMSAVISKINSQGIVPSNLRLDRLTEGLIDNLTIVVLTDDGDKNTGYTYAYKSTLGSGRINGKTVGNYNILPEESIYFSLGEGGTIAHEFLHSCGYPDLYRANSSSDVSSGIPVYRWCIMSSSDYRMLYPLAYLRSEISGWFDMDVISESRNNITLYPASRTNDSNKNQQAVILKTPYSDNEFFVVEYRYKALDTTEYDSSLPGTGLIVYRVNTACSTNKNGPPDMIYVFRPGDSLRSTGGEVAGFTGLTESYLSSQSGRTSYGTADLQKSLADNAITYSDGQNSGIVINNIGSAGDTISFDVSFNSDIDNTAHWDNLCTKNTAAGSIYSDMADNELAIYSINSSDNQLYRFDGTDYAKISQNSFGSNIYVSDLCVHNNMVYVAYSTATQTSVATFNGSGWTKIYSAPKSAGEVKLTSADDCVYLTYSVSDMISFSESYFDIYVVKIAGSAVSNLGSVRKNGFMFGNIDLAVESGEPYVSCRDASDNSILVSKYSGGQWNSVESDIKAGITQMAVYGSRLYMITTNSQNVGKNGVFYYDKSNQKWEMIGGEYTSGPVGDVSLNVIDGVPYCVFSENGEKMQGCYYSGGEWKSLGNSISASVSCLDSMYYDGKIYAQFLNSEAGVIKIYSASVKADGSAAVDDEEEEEEEEEDLDWGELTEEDRQLYSAPKEIPNSVWVSGISDTTFTGRAITFPDLRVYDGKLLLKAGQDYTLSYRNNVNANDGTVASKAPRITITGKGNFTGSITKIFRILPADISVDLNEDGTYGFTAADLLYNCNSKVQLGVPGLYFISNGKKYTLRNKTDFTCTYPHTNSKAEDYDSDAFRKENNEGEAYEITLTGKGNYTGTRTVLEKIVPKSHVLVSKLRVEVAAQNYTGQEICPDFVVKNGRTILSGMSEADYLNATQEERANVDYTYSYSDNISIGTGHIVITGRGSYHGERTVNFAIRGASLKKVSVAGVVGSFVYTGQPIEQKIAEIEPANNEEHPEWEIAGDGVKLYTVSTVGRVKVTKYLHQGRDYNVRYTSNVNAGTATIWFDGIGNYTDTIKKTFRITAFNMNWDTYTYPDESVGSIKVTDEAGNDYPQEICYEKNGVYPKPQVTFTRRSSEGEILFTKNLEAGVDYSLSYANNGGVNDGTNSRRMPTIKISGRKNFSQTRARETFRISRQTLGNDGIIMSANDVVYKNKANNYTTSVLLKDVNGKALAAGRDFSKAYKYFYTENTTLANGSEREADSEVLKGDIVPAGTTLKVDVQGIGAYTDNKQALFRVVEYDISKAKVAIASQYYTGKSLTPSGDQVIVTYNNIRLGSEDYVIKEYINNKNRGTAKLVIMGKGRYGGSKTVSYSIAVKALNYTVIFSGNGADGGSMGSISLAYNKPQKLPANKYTRKGYIFTGWNTRADGKGKFYSDKDIIVNSTNEVGYYRILYAQWK